MIKSVLLCCFDFPPNYGIGGRRWAKFAKGLAVAGIKVYVVKPNPLPFQSDSIWTDDVNHENIKVYSFPRAFNLELESSPSLVKKLAYKFIIWKIKRLEKGTIYDAAVGCGETFKNLASKIIKSNSIEHVIATGAPFNLLYYVAQLKKEIGGFQLISDYRDPWIYANNYGMQNLSLERLNVEKSKERLVIESSEYLISPSMALLSPIKRDHDYKHTSHFVELAHCFDPDDTCQVDKPSPPQGVTRLTYGGSLYIGLDSIFHNLTKILDAYHSKYARWPDIEITIYTDDYEKYTWLSSYNDCIRILPSVGRRLGRELLNSHGALIMLSEHTKDFFTTKFYDAIPFQIPYVYLGPDGKVSKYIESNSIGIVLRDLSDLEHLLQILPKWTNEKSFNSHLNRNSLETRTNELLAILDDHKAIQHKSN